MKDSKSRTTKRFSFFRVWKAKRKNEGGFVLAYVALTIPVLIGIGGFAVDVGNWYLQVQRLQRSADSAALAGAVYLPGDPTTATSTARDVLARNVDASNVQSVQARNGHPTQLRVELSRTVNNYFTGLLGYHRITLTRSAIGEYRPYVPMGSPSNVLGQEPSNGGTSWENNLGTLPRQSHYWLDFAAAGTDKVNGDRYGAGLCTSSPDACSTSGVAPFTNLDYSQDGEAFTVRIAAGTIGNLTLQAYDAGFANVGTTCTDSDLDNANSFSPPGTNLYRAGNSEPGCTGDGQVSTGKVPQNTTYTLWTPEQSAGGSQPIATTNCRAKTYTGYDGAIRNKVNPLSAQYDPEFVGWFRKWNTICSLPLTSGMPSGDYILKVTNGNSTNNSGHNRFALRAAILNTNGTVNSSMSAGVALFARGRLVVYAHDDSGDVVFYVARVNSGAAGRQLTVTLFDIGDSTGGANLSFLPPQEAQMKNSSGTLVPMPSWQSCQYTPPNQTTYVNAASGCSINNIGTSYNGRIINLTTQIPDTYVCSDSSNLGCWARLRIHYNSGTTTDTTSWEVALDGNPVRLVVEN